MPAPEQVLYAMPAMRALLRAEARAVCARLPKRMGSYGLRLGMHAEAGDCPDAVAHWTRLRWQDGGWRGDVRARSDEPLPFQDDTFCLAWLSYALHHLPNAGDLLGEMARVVAPGGLMVLSGMHPISVWAPWLAWSLRGSIHPLYLRAPLHLAQAVTRMGFDVQETVRFGPVLPRATTPSSLSSALGGGFLLLARKRQETVTTMGDVRSPRRARLRGSLASGAHRECA